MSSPGHNDTVHSPDHNLQPQKQFFAEQLNQSKVQSIISHSNNPQNLLKYFQDYKPTLSQFSMEKLHKSQKLKLKKYKGSIYYGEFHDGRRHGQGIMVYDNGRVYEGEWKLDYKDGTGYERFPNDCIYQGQYVNGKPEGIGKYIWPNGQFYQGEWVNGMKQGSGMWRGVKGDSYIGEWKFGKTDGYGVHTWVNGDRYQGQFKQCLKDGQGIEKFANGDLYKGMYSKGKPSGYGQYYWSNGSYFKGNFKDGLRDGQGIWKKGHGSTDIYEGGYKDDKKSGYGIFTWSTGNVYKGNYSQNLRNGYGQMYWVDGSFYKGQWKDGIQDGQGELFVPGEGFKKGIFENNVLIIVQEQSNVSASLKKKQSSEVDPQRQLHNASTSTRPKHRREFLISNPKQRTLEPNRGQKSREVRSLDQVTVPRNSRHSQPPVYLPARFQTRETKPAHQRRVLKPTPQTKERILHSSFYMHRLHSRVANGTVVGSRAEARSGYSVENQDKAGEGMKVYTKNKAFSSSRTPYL